MADIILKPLVKSVEYTRDGDRLTAYVGTAERCNASVSPASGARVLSNLNEPFDFRMHIFSLDAEKIEAAGGFETTFERRRKDRPSECFADGEYYRSERIAFSAESVLDPGESRRRSDRGLIFEEVLESRERDGFSYKLSMWRTPAGAPVRTYVMKADPRRYGILCGTPHMKPVFTPGEIQKVMEEAEDAIAAGYDVAGATNADFFDMFGDCHPSGLCVSRGQLVANGDSPNPFFGVLKDGTPIIGRLDDYPLNDVEEAVGCGQIIVKDGKIADTAAFRPFGEVAHPRTAFGIDGDGRVIAMVVDGRRPAWSNGAALVELAKLMIEEGAEIAVNTDGGGSSTFIVDDGGLKMLNHPADLVRPDEDLIRPLFDSLIIYRKNTKQGSDIK